MSKKTVLLRSFKVIFFVLFVFFLFAFSIKDGISAQETKDFVVRERAVIVEENKTPFLYLKSFFSDIGSIFSPESSVPEIFVSDEAYPGSGSQTQTPQQLSGGGGIPICGSGEFNVVEAEKEEAVGIKGFFQKVIRVFFPEPDLPLMLVGENCRYPFSGEGIDKEDDIETPDEAGRQGWDTAKSEGKSDEEARYIAEAAYNNFISNSPNWKENVSPEKVASGRSITDAARLAEIERIKRETGKTDTNMFSAEEVQRVKDAGIISGEREMVRERASRYGIDTSSYTNKEIDDLFIECPDLEGLDRNIVQFEQDKVVRAEVEARAKEQAKIAAIKEVEAQKQEEAGPAWGFTQGGVVKKRVSEPASEGEGGQWFTEEELKSEPKSAIELSTKQKLEVESQAGAEARIGQKSTLPPTGIGSFFSYITSSLGITKPQVPDNQGTGMKYPEAEKPKAPDNQGAGMKYPQAEKPEPPTGIGSYFSYITNSLGITKPKPPANQGAGMKYPDAVESVPLETIDRMVGNIDKDKLKKYAEDIKEKVPVNSIVVFEKEGIDYEAKIIGVGPDGITILSEQAGSEPETISLSEFSNSNPRVRNTTPSQIQRGTTDETGKGYGSGVEEVQPRDIAAEKGEGSGISAGDITTRVYESPSLVTNLMSRFGFIALKETGISSEEEGAPEQIRISAGDIVTQGGEVYESPSLVTNFLQAVGLAKPDNYYSGSGMKYPEAEPPQVPANQGAGMKYPDIEQRQQDAIDVARDQREEQVVQIDSPFAGEELRQPVREVKLPPGVWSFEERERAQQEQERIEAEEAGKEFQWFGGTKKPVVEQSVAVTEGGSGIGLTSLVRKYFTPAVQQRIRDNLVNTLTTSQTDFFEKKGPATVYSIKYEWSVPAKQFEWGRLSGGVIPTQEQLELFKKGDFGNPELAKILDNNTRELLKSAYNSGNPAPLVAVNTLEVDPASNQRAMELIKWVNAASTEEERARRVEEAKTDSQLRRLAAEVVGRTVNLTVDGRKYEGLVVDVAQIGHGLEMLGLLPQDEVGLGTKFTVDIVNSDFAKKMGVAYSDEGVPQYGIANVTLKVEQPDIQGPIGKFKNSLAKLVASIPIFDYDITEEGMEKYYAEGKKGAATEEKDEIQETKEQEYVDYDDFVFFGESRKTEAQKEVETTEKTQPLAGEMADVPEKKTTFSQIQRETTDQTQVPTDGKTLPGYGKPASPQSPEDPDKAPTEIGSIIDSISKRASSILGGVLPGYGKPALPQLPRKPAVQIVIGQKGTFQGKEAEIVNRTKEGIVIEYQPEGTEQTIQTTLDNQQYIEEFEEKQSDQDGELEGKKLSYYGQPVVVEKVSEDEVAVRYENPTTAGAEKKIFSKSEFYEDFSDQLEEEKTETSVYYNALRYLSPVGALQAVTDVLEVLRGTKNEPEVTRPQAQDVISETKEEVGKVLEIGDKGKWNGKEVEVLKKLGDEVLVEYRIPGGYEEKVISLENFINVPIEKQGEEQDVIEEGEIELSFSILADVETISPTIGIDEEAEEVYTDISATETISGLVLETDVDEIIPQVDKAPTMAEWRLEGEKQKAWNEKYKDAKTETERFELIRDGYSNLGLAGAGLSTVDNVLSHAEDAFGQVPVVGGFLGLVPGVLNPRKLGMDDLEAREAMEEIAAGKSYFDATESLSGYGKQKIRLEGAINAIKSSDVSIPEKAAISVLTFGDAVTMGSLGGYQEAQMKANITGAGMFSAERVLPTAQAGFDVATVILPGVSPLVFKAVPSLARFVVQKPLTAAVSQKAIEPMLSTGLGRFVSKYTPTAFKKTGGFLARTWMPEPSENIAVGLIKKDIGKAALEDGAFKAAIKAGDKETIDQIVRRLAMQKGYPDEKITKEVMEKVIVGLSEQVRGTPGFMAVVRKEVLDDARANSGFVTKENIETRLRHLGYPEEQLDKGVQSVMDEISLASKTAFVPSAGSVKKRFSIWDRFTSEPTKIRMKVVNGIEINDSQITPEFVKNFNKGNYDGEIRERLFKAGYAEDSIGLGITEVKKSLRERLKFEKKALVQTMKDEDINWSSLVRDPVEQPKAKTVSNFKYWSNQNDARKVFLKALESGEIDDLDSFIALTKKMHEVAVEGADGTNLYYKKPVDPGVYRSGSGWHNNYVDESYEVQNLAKKIGVKIDYDKEWKVRLSGIPENGLPENVGTEHLYPDPRYIDDYFDQMYQSLQRLDEIPLHVNGGQEAAVREIATYYQYGANARPFENINNSIFMNEANVLLRSRGLEEIPHGLLDHAAQRLQPEEFQKLFLKSVAEKNPGL